MSDQSKLTIRRAGIADASVLAELGARTFSDTFAADCDPEDMAAYMSTAFSPAVQTAELLDESSLYLIAEIEDDAVGYAQLHACAPPPECVTGAMPLELARFYVIQPFHGRGVAARLMQACLDEARRMEHQTMWLGVWEHNHRAQAFYRKWNFEMVGSHVFQLGSDAQTDLLMARGI